MDLHDRIIAEPQLFNGNVPASRPSPKPQRPLPQVADVTLADVDLANEASQQHATEAIIESLKVSGACFVRNMVSKRALGEIELDIRPHLNAAKVWKGMVILLLHQSPPFTT